MRTSKRKLTTYGGGFDLVLKACQTFVMNKEETNLFVTDLSVANLKVSVANRGGTENLDIVVDNDDGSLLSKPQT